MKVRCKRPKGSTLAMLSCRKSPGKPYFLALAAWPHSRDQLEWGFCFLLLIQSSSGSIEKPAAMLS